jgi:hypothetical protein
MSIETLHSVGKLDAVTFAATSGHQPPVEACSELAEEAHREAARGGGSASALSPASCKTEPPVDPPSSKRHFY